jgi:hypothetical protein
MIKKLFLFSSFLFLINCGYEPLFVNKKTPQIQIGEINIKGDEKINRKILSLIGVKETKDTANDYLLLINSKKKKEIVAKNSAGNSTSFKISIDINISIIDSINNKKILKSKKFNSSFTYNNTNDKFQLSQDEKNILNNLIESTSEKIVIYLNS